MDRCLQGSCALLNFRYAAEVDVDFVRKSVRAIGRCAIKVEQAAERCVGTLLDLIQTKVNYVVQEAIVVIKVGGHSSVSKRKSGLTQIVPWLKQNNNGACSYFV